MQKKPVVKKYTGADALWLFSKVIVFLLVHLISLLTAVVLAVWTGGMAFITTNSKLFGFMAGIAAYMACMAGRTWLNDLMVHHLFSIGDMMEMDNKIGDKRGPRDP
jgi:uncharacterized membrane protein AbrB (regulator of aidB expression)